MQRAMKGSGYTLKDYLSWPDEERWEIIDGAAYALSPPAPALGHQTLTLAISSQLYLFLKGKPCRVFASPVDVVFSQKDDTDTVVQPDIAVVCDPAKLGNGKRITGAPDIVVEILSPSTILHDMNDKKALYEREGVPEYWIVSPDERAISRQVLQNGRYEAKTYYEGVIETERLPGFALDIEELFGSLEGL